MTLFYQILRQFVAFVLAAALGSVAMLGLHTLSGVIWPEYAMERMPSDPVQLEAFLMELPLSVQFSVLVAHWAGAILGAVVAMLVTRRQSRWPGVALGAWFMIGGIANNWMLPAPLWMEALDLVGYIPLAFGVSYLLHRAPEAASS
jgi:hypothetical protein